MAKVNFIRKETDEELNNVPINDGNFLISKEGTSYVDYDDTRVGLGGTPDSEMSDSSINSVQNRVAKAYADAIQGNVGDLQNLPTVDKTSIVNSITEVYSKVMQANEVLLAILGAGHNGSGTYKVPFNISKKYGVGESFSFQNNGCMINDNTRLVMVSGILEYSWSATKSHDLNLIVKLERNGEAQVVATIFGRSHSGSGTTPLSLPKIPVEVQKGDFIYFEANSGDSAVASGLMGFSNRITTHMMIEKII